MNKGSALLLPLLALTGLLLAGCASSRDPATARYYPNQGKTKYRSRSINLGTLFESGGLGTDPRVTMRGWASCDGENCRPREAWLSFSLQRSAKEMQLRVDRSVTIKTDGDFHSWKQKDISHSRAPVQGEIARVALDLSALQDIATSQRFDGSIGGESFSLSYEERAPLRALYGEATAAK